MTGYGLFLPAGSTQVAYWAPLNFANLYANTWVKGAGWALDTLENGQYKAGAATYPPNGIAYPTTGQVGLLCEQPNPNTSDGNYYFNPSFDAGQYTGFTPVNGSGYAQLGCLASGTTSTIQAENGVFGAYVQGDDYSGVPSDVGLAQMTAQFNFPINSVPFSNPNVVLTSSINLAFPYAVNEPYIKLNLGFTGPGSTYFEFTYVVRLASIGTVTSPAVSTNPGVGVENAYTINLSLGNSDTDAYMTTNSGAFTGSTWGTGASPIYNTLSFSISYAQFQAALEYMASQTGTGWSPNPFVGNTNPALYALQQHHLNAEMQTSVAGSIMGWSAKQWTLTLAGAAATPCATPTFSPAAGTYSSAQSVTISCATAGASIYYTTDGSTPTTASTPYTGAVSVSASQTLKAIATDAPAYTQSAVGSASYTIAVLAATPTFSPGTGSYSGTQSVTISSATAGALIYYTTDGSTPTTSSTLYSGPISVASSETVKAIATHSGYVQSNVGSAVYVIAVGGYLGMNGTPLSYFSSEAPFLNTIKQSTSNNNGVAWSTPSVAASVTAGSAIITSANAFAAGTPVIFGGGGFASVTGLSTGKPYFVIATNLSGTHFSVAATPGGTIITTGGTGSSNSGLTVSVSALDLVLDSDGNCTSLTTRSGAVISSVNGSVFVGTNNGSANPVPNLSTTELYPPGPYTFGVTLTGNVTFSADVTAVSVASGSATLVSGLQYACTGACTFNLTLGNGETNSGMRWAFSNFTSGYPQVISNVQTAYLSQYTAGNIGHPTWKAFMSPFSSWRTMKPCNTNSQIYQVVLTASPSAGTNVAATISEVYNGGGPSAGDTSYWPLQTGTYTFCMNDGTQVQVNCTYGVAAVVIQSLAATQTSATCYALMQPTFASRSLPSNYTWAGLQGMPIDAVIALGNELGVDVEYCLPISANSTFISDTAAMFASGTGATLTNAQSGLTKRAKVALGNEVWNSTYFDNKYQALQAAANGEAGAFWFGGAVAGVGQAFHTAYGSAFSSRCTVILGGQFAWTTADSYGSAGPYYLSYSMNALAGSGGTAVYTNYVGAVSIAPYINVGGIDSGDITKLLASTNPLNSWFDLAYAQTDRYGTNYPSMATTGWLGSTIATAEGLIALLSYAGPTDSPPYGAGNAVWGPGGSAPVEILAYEAGTQWQNQSSAFQAFLYTALRDARMQYVYNDPTHQLSSNPGYYPALVAAGFTNLNHFASIGSLLSESTCVAMENVMQPTSGANTPPILIGLQQYAA